MRSPGSLAVAGEVGAAGALDHRQVEDGLAVQAIELDLDLLHGAVEAGRDHGHGVPVLHHALDLVAAGRVHAVADARPLLAGQVVDHDDVEGGVGVDHRHVREVVADGGVADAGDFEHVDDFERHAPAEVDLGADEFSENGLVQGGAHQMFSFGGGWKGQLHTQFSINSVFCQVLLELYYFYQKNMSLLFPHIVDTNG